MGDQRLAAVQGDEQIFGAARQAFDPLTRKPLAETRRERKADVAAPDLNPFNPRADHRRREPPPDRLDLRQFRHKSVQA